MIEIMKEVKKIKRARKSLKTLKKKWEEMDILEISSLFSKILKVDYNRFKVKEVFDIIFFEVIISNFVEDKKSRNYEEMKRNAIKFAVANAWYFYNSSKSVDTTNRLITSIHNNPESINAADRLITIIHNYKNREIEDYIPINLFQNIWKVTFKESDDWLLVYDLGFGWYWPLNEINNLKLKRQKFG